MKSTIAVVLILITSVLITVHCQDDEDEEDTYDEGTESETTTEAESDEEETTTFGVGDVIRAIGALSKSSNGSVSPEVLTSLLTMVLNNNGNPQSQGAAAAVPTVDPDIEVSSTSRGAYFVGQVNKLITSGSRGNLSGVVDNAVAIGAPASVQVVMSNVLSTLNRWTGGIFGLTFLETTPTPIAASTAPPPAPPAISAADIEAALGVTSKPLPLSSSLSKTPATNTNTDPNSLQSIIDNILAQQNISVSRYSK